MPGYTERKLEVCLPYLSQVEAGEIENSLHLAKRRHLCHRFEYLSLLEENRKMVYVGAYDHTYTIFREFQAA